VLLCPTACTQPPYRFTHPDFLSRRTMLCRVWLLTKDSIPSSPLVSCPQEGQGLNKGFDALPCAQVTEKKST
jgi:hypothetical protein